MPEAQRNHTRPRLSDPGSPHRASGLLWCHPALRAGTQAPTPPARHPELIETAVPLRPPRVSVCIPAYNHERYIAECIESVLNQTFQDFEVLVTDDHSTDRTPEIIASFRDDRIRVWRHARNLGPSATANNNMVHATGEYLAFLPSDDAFEPEKLERQCAVLDARPELGAVFTRPLLVDEDGRAIEGDGHFAARVFEQPNRAPEEWLRTFFLQGNCLCGPTAMVRRQVVERVGLHDLRLLQLQDLDYWIRLCLDGPIHVMEERLTRFRVRADDANTSAPKPDAVARHLWETSKLLHRYLALDDRERFAAVFPEARPLLESGASLRFALARTALGAALQPVRAFGLDLLYEILQDADETEALARLGFSVPDFFREVASVDVYNWRRITGLEAEGERLTEALRGAAEEIDSTRRQGDARAEAMGKALRNVEERMAEQQTTLEARIETLERRAKAAEDENAGLRDTLHRLNRVALALAGPRSMSMRERALREHGLVNVVVTPRGIGQLLPAHDLAVLPDGRLRATGVDPQLVLDVPGVLPQGWCRLGGRIPAVEGRVPLELYFDTGGGFHVEARASVWLPNDAEGEVLVRLPDGIRRLRIDPPTLDTPFTIEALRIVAISRVSAGLRVAAAVVRSRVRRPGDLKRIAHSAARHVRAHGVRSLKRLLFQMHHQRQVAEGDIAMQALLSGEGSRWMLARTRERLEDAHYRPVISIVMPVHDTPPALLAAAVDSVREQIYPDWELCIADDASTRDETSVALRRLAASDPRIRVVTLPANRGISGATNAALELAQGEFVALLDHDDTLAPDALAEIVLALNEDPEIDVLYTDQDKIDDEGRRSEPFFKPDWSPDYFLRVMYVGHLLVFRRALAARVGGFDSRFDRVQDYEFMLRLSEHTQRIRHVPHILYHWRATAGSIAADANAKGDVEKLQVAAVRAHLERKGVAARVHSDPHFHHHAVLEPPPRAHWPKVSIVIPTRDAPHHIGRCLASIFERTTYPDFEVVAVDNGTTDRTARAILEQYRIRVVPYDEPFNFSRANNLGVAAAAGEYVVLLNNDTEVITPDWLQLLVFHLEQPDVGAVGPLLLYPDDTVQHAGVVIGARGTADHVMRHFPAETDGYAGSLSCTREVSAVTGACLVCRRRDYETLGGLSELYATHYQDVDFCLRVLASGRRILFVPQARLYHHESATRGTYYDFVDRLLLRDTWGDLITRGDPYYNRNLSLARLDYTLRGADEVTA